MLSSLAMVRCARAWGLVVAIGIAQACALDTSGLGSEGTASLVDPSSTGSGAATTGTTTADDTTTAASTGPIDPDDTTAAGSTTGASTTNDDGTTAAADTQSGPKDIEYCFDINASIPDDNAAGIGSSFTVEEVGVVLDVRLVVEVTHTWVGDLIVELRNDAGTTLAVIDRPGVLGGGDNGCSGNDIDVLLSDDASQTIDDACLPEGGGIPAISGTLLPANPFAGVFVGEPAAGNWRLRAIDANNGDMGTLVSWCLQLTYE